MNELLFAVQKYVKLEGKILSFVIGVFEKENFTFSYQYGICVATNMRIIFYGKLPYYPATFEEYAYLYMEDIGTIPQLAFTHNGETVTAKHIQKGNIEQFAYVVQGHLNN
ncbi:PH domain-containing protein [Bacillus sp. DX1.1]|uniref:PH domain-containing protein n=1 Tax=unclassified Bacillus (in: firmicutes) TaxID=185979 RepID=UPI00257035A1|nr:MULTISPECIES: PH domain-containing protein [unclassified Bacillus (in: firmicutes)]MDM5153012.1 PH domain-containing protein [Bacillus sp. DX1.1]WJE81989.1 PH domain-containing protein [Bacillus sp. DX3.1]